MKTKIFFTLLFPAIVVSLSCSKKEKETDPYASFTLNGTAVQMNSHSKFNRNCVLTYFCGSFMADKAITDKNHIWFGFPQDVAAGKTYHAGDNHFQVYYLNSSGNRYDSYYGGNITVTVSLWEGNNGKVKASFHGTLPFQDNPQNDSVIIQNGTFEGRIWYIE
jgi:hypothetical protein